MSVSTAHSTVAELVRSFTDADPGRAGAEYGPLVKALWNDGALTGLALPAVPELVAQLAEVDDERKGHLVVLLGLLAEAEYPAAGEVTAAVREGLDLYLDLWSRSPNGEPLSTALAYLVAHFPDDRDRILAVAAGRELDADDLTRLERALDRLDPDNPVLGRVFPSPAVWALMDGDEREFDQSWIRALPAEQIQSNWEKDTRTVLAHAGAKAYWAVCNGTPAPVVTGSVPPRDANEPLPGLDVEAFGRHADAFRCPSCHAGLDFASEGIRCTGCSTEYAVAGGILNLLEGAERNGDDFLYRLAEMPSMGLFYEAYARPNFLRIAGGNWGGQVTPADEKSYILEHVRPVAGPVLDLAAGAGTWTAMLTEAVGAERVIALDMYPPMLSALRRKLVEVPAVMASAAVLPFDDASLGAVICWNALQAFPDHAAAAIAEVGRCLRPGGTFTLLTFNMAEDPIARYFQASHYFPGHQEGMQLFEPGDIKRWLTDAGLVVHEESRPGTFIIITAQRPE
ncbi:hypothetical protein GCM10022226_14100 [Sphaerisporangium flaviroseum]|uniref:Methyltransferase domain-containing protein n=1 Tax=Sphaerisporangium flaviroseum TaxID=509199 RepID=A0ABP7HLE5_9ACTN